MIEVSNLSKRFGSVLAVDNLSFKTGAGQVLGFLGPNGAGKSTTMKIISGFFPPSSGSIKVCGYDLATDPVAVKREIGYLPEGAPVYGEMFVGEFLQFVARIRKLKGAAAKNAIAYVVELLQLETNFNKPIDTLSKGFKRRVGLAQTLLHDPKVLILDEPTDGLDPNQKHQVRNLIRRLTSEKTVIISTHILEEVSAVCNRVLIISEGRLLIDETPDAMLRRSGYHNAASMFCTDQKLLEKIGRLQEVGKLESDQSSGRIIVFPKNENEDIYPFLKQQAFAQAWPVHDLRPETGRLEDVFRKLTAGKVS